MLRKLLLLNIFLYAEIRAMYIKEIVNEYKPTKDEEAWSYNKEKDNEFI